MGRGAMQQCLRDEPRRVGPELARARANECVLTLRFRLYRVVPCVAHSVGETV